jgi:protein tyrosine/serine phosphatase
MKTAIRYFSFYMVIALSVSSFAHGQKAAKNKDLPNFSEVNSNLFRGGQPKEEGIKQLAKMGVKTFINLRGEDDLSKKEKKWVQDSGMKFIGVSLNNWFKPKDADIEKIIAMIDNAENQPVFVHCQRGADRTGTVIAVYRMTHENWTAKEANKEAKEFGFGWWQFWMKDYINDYYENLQAEKKKAGEN